MSIPNAAFSVRIQLELPNTPGAFARVATAIGDAGGTLGPLDIVDIDNAKVIRDVTVYAIDGDHLQTIEAQVKTLEGVSVRSVADRVMAMHHKGKLSVSSKFPVRTRDDLSLAYTPGVGRVCRAIADDPTKVRQLTIKSNTVAIVSDGTAVLGLGNIGPEAAIPVMEGKAQLFKEFAGIDGFPICLRIDPPNEDGTDPGVDQIVEAVMRLEPVFGGINLEDIAAPRCFEVERRLQEILSIPVFHDDQHGTAVVTTAALRNALKLVKKDISDVRIVIAGAGAAGVAVGKMLLSAGAKHLILCDRKGAIHAGGTYADASKQWIADNTNVDGLSGSLQDVLKGADVFIGVSGPNLLVKSDLETMATDPIVFALANPDPEVPFMEAQGVAAVYATGRSDYPNQINNVLCYPGIFRGALDAEATTITPNMTLAAADAIAGAIAEEDLSPTNIIPSVFNREVASLVASAVAAAAIQDGVAPASEVKAK
jgi:malate dehydrogenase (oxaloacetate-decarboxylating)